AGTDQLVGQGDGIDAGQTHLVDRQRGHVPSDTRAHGRLTCGHLTGAGREHLTHDHVVDQRRLDIGLLKGPLDRDRAQVTARKFLQRTHQLADRRAGASNDHRRRHQYLQKLARRLEQRTGEAESFPSGYRYVMTTEQVDARPVLASALVTALDHVGIAVADLDAAIAWFHDHLGMIVLHEEVNDDQGIREAMLSVRGAPVGSAQVQLMAPVDDSSAIAKFLDKRGPGLQQMAYRVSDLDQLSTRLQDQGVRLIYDAPRRGTSDSRINFIHPKDAGGVLIELVEPAAD